MFKVIESDEEFEAASAAGLLWMNVSSLFPRPADAWCLYDGRMADTYWRGKTNDPDGYMPEDFAVLVEEDLRGQVRSSP